MAPPLWAPGILERGTCRDVARQPARRPGSPGPADRGRLGGGQGSSQQSRLV